MRRELDNTDSGKTFQKGDIVKCTYSYKPKSQMGHPIYGQIYEVIDCYTYLNGEFIDIFCMEDGYKGGGWYADSFTDVLRAPIAKPEKKKEEWRRIDL